MRVRGARRSDQTSRAAKYPRGTILHCACTEDVTVHVDVGVDVHRLWFTSNVDVHVFRARSSRPFRAPRGYFFLGSLRAAAVGDIAHRLRLTAGHRAPFLALRAVWRRHRDVEVIVGFSPTKHILGIWLTCPRPTASTVTSSSRRETARRSRCLVRVDRPGCQRDARRHECPLTFCFAGAFTFT